MKPAFIKFYFADWFAGVREIKNEGVRCFYFELIGVLAERGGRVPKDPERVAELMPQFGIRKTKRILAELVSRGKIMVHGDAIGNNRLDIELAKIEAKSERTSKGEKTKATRRQNEDSLPEVCGKFGDNYPQTIPKLSDSLPQTSPPNQTKSITYEAASERQNSHTQILRYSDTKKEENSQPANSVHVAAGELAGLNGSTTEIINGLARWLEPTKPDVATATRVISRDLALYGPQAVKDGYADLATAIDANEPVANPLKAYHGFVKNAAERLAGRKEAAKKRGKTYGEAAPMKTFADRQEGLRQTYDKLCQLKLQGKPWPDHPELPAPGKPGSEKFADILKLHMLPVYSARSGATDWGSAIDDAIPTEVL